MKKKHVVAFLATLFFILAVPIVTLAQPATPTADNFGVEDASGNKGTYVVVPVNITNATNGPILGIGFDIAYDKNVINVTNVSKGNLVPNWADPNVNNNFTWGTKIRIAGFYAADAIPSGSSGSVVLLNFSVVGPVGDTSPMNMTLIELSNLEGIVGTAQARNGTFTIVSPGTDTAPPVTTITFPLNGSTIGILNNSVIGNITDESALETAYLTLNDTLVTNLSKGPFNVKVNYTANATNKIEVFAKDIAGNANSTQVLVNVLLPNVVVVNTTIVPNETKAITEAKNATNTVIELNAIIAANVSVTIKANTDASALNAEPATSAYGLAQNQLSLEKYIDVNITGIDKANLTFVSLYLFYTTADLDRTGDGDAGDIGDLNEQTLKMYWFNPNTRRWMPLGPSPDADERPDYTALGGPKVIDDERNTNKKYIKVTLNHFSTFALVAEVIPTPPNGGGGGGAFIPSPSLIPPSTLTATPALTETPTPAPTITPSATPTQTPLPTPAPVTRLPPLFLILIVIAVIVIAGIIIIIVMRR